MADDQNLSDKVAIAALVIAVVAFVTTVVQLAQTIIASAKGLPNCDERVMGKWARYTSRKFKWRQLRLEIDFEAPLIFLAPSDNIKGPAGLHHEVPIWYVDGSRASCESTRVAEPRAEGAEDVDVVFQTTGMVREPVHTVDNELATWVKMLGAIQKMERDSRSWEAGRWRSVQLPHPQVDRFSLAVGIQAKKRSFDANPTVKKPYATTAICHIVELAAVLGLYWKEFNRDQNKYRAEGNGYSLLGSRVDDFGIVFVFEKVAWPKFAENRIIPTSEVKELCFGNAPTFYRRKNPIADEGWNAPFSEQKTLLTLQLGSRREIAETLNLIGCNTTTSLYYLREKKHIHLFPVTFEILGMLSRTMHIKNRSFTYLPNPTIFQWSRASFSLRRMLDEFHKHIRGDVDRFSREGYVVPAELEQLAALASKLQHELPTDRSSDFAPDHLNELHEALDKTTDMLAPDRIDKDVVLDVLRRHLQEVLLAINTTADQAAGRAPTTPVALADISFDDLLGVPPENREREFMKKYFTEIRHRVISTDSTDHHDPQAADASLSIHTQIQQQAQQQEAQQQQQQRQQPSPPTGHTPPGAAVGGSTSVGGGGGGQQAGGTPHGSPDPSSQAITTTTHTPTSPPHPPPINTIGGLGSRVGTMSLPRRANTWGTSLSNAFEVRRNNIWCALIFRMILWLLLHDFDKNDIQVSKSELMGSRLPVYIM